LLRHIHAIADIRTWHNNIEQHASEGVNKILIGNKSDWTDKKAVTEEQGRELADEFGIRFMETSAKVNEGVEEAFFTLARSDLPALATLTPEGPLIWNFPLEISKLD
jgi:Ras-related protein Rab-8A